MKNWALLILLAIVNCATAQTESDHRLFALKDLDVAPVPEKSTSLATHFSKNFKPATKVTKPIEVSFVIEKVGVLRDVKVFTDLPDDTRKEVIRTIKMLPKWSPGQKSGQPVRVLYKATLKP